MASRLASADLQSQIATLQAEFQRIADVHPWICLAVPRPECGPPSLGEVYGSPSLPDFGVRQPTHRAVLAILDHLSTLTYRADRLLLLAIEQAPRIPPDIVQEIREQAQQCFGCGWWGWVSWLRYAVPVRIVHRFENYPQVAATALVELRFWIGAGIGTPRGHAQPKKTKKRLEESPKPSDKLKDQVYKWIQGEYAAGNKPASILAALKENRDRMAQVNAGGLKAGMKLIRAALTLPKQRKRDEMRKKQESPST